MNDSKPFAGFELAPENICNANMEILQKSKQLSRTLNVFTAVYGKRKVIKQDCLKWSESKCLKQRKKHKGSCTDSTREKWTIRNSATAEAPDDLTSTAQSDGKGCTESSCFAGPRCRRCGPTSASHFLPYISNSTKAVIWRRNAGATKQRQRGRKRSLKYPRLQQGRKRQKAKDAKASQ